MSYDFCRNARLFASVSFTIDRVTTQHATKCVENCSDAMYRVLIYLNIAKFSVTSVITLKTACFFLKCRLTIML